MQVSSYHMDILIFHYTGGMRRIAGCDNTTICTGRQLVEASYLCQATRNSYITAINKET